MSPRLDAVGIVVSDLARALDFYGRLGVGFPPGSESEGHVEATLPSGIRLMLDTEETVRSFDPGWTRSEATSIALAFLCDSPAEVDRLHGELVAAGYASKSEPWDAVWGQRYAQLHDPDGHAVDLFAPR